MNNLHEMFARDMISDAAIRNGMSIAGLVIVLLCLIVGIYGVKHQKESEIQRTHVCFGYVLVLLRIIIAILGRIPDKACCGATLGFFLTMVFVSVMLNKANKIKAEEKKRQKLEEHKNKKLNDVN